MRYTRDKLLEVIECYYLDKYYLEAQILADKKAEEYLSKKHTRKHFIKRAKQLKQNELKRKFSLLSFRNSPSDGVIYYTLKHKKRLRLINSCQKLIYVGCGYYPFSLFDIYKKYKHIEMIGLERDIKAFNTCSTLVKHSPTKDRITIHNSDGKKFDYSILNENDLILIAPEIEMEGLPNQIISTTTAKFYKCGNFYSETWMKGYLNEK